MLTDESRRAMIEAIHRTETMLVLAVAGGGNAVIADLLDVGGASRTILEVRVPYAATAMADLVAAAPPRSDAGAVSPAMAEAMATACLHRAETIAPAGTTVIGVGCTASIASDRPKRGEHRAYVAAAARARADRTSADRAGAGGDGAKVQLSHRSVELTKGKLDRKGEDRIVADAVIELAAAACGVAIPSRSDEPWRQSW